MLLESSIIDEWEELSRTQTSKASIHNFTIELKARHIARCVSVRV